MTDEITACVTMPHNIVVPTSWEAVVKAGTYRVWALFRNLDDANDWVHNPENGSPEDWEVHTVIFPTVMRRLL